MPKLKLLYIISNVTNSKGFEWTFEYLDKSLFEIHVILLNETLEKNGLVYFFEQHPEITYSQWCYQSKKEIPQLIWKAYRYIKSNHITIVHSHLFEGSIIGTTAGRLARIKKNFYTRHHSSYHHDYFPKTVKYDKWVNKMASHIVAISQGVKDILVEKENVSPDKITIIPHGFDITKFENVPPDSLKKIREKYAISTQAFVIGVVSRYESLKGIEYIIDAFGKYQQTNKDALLILANASGNNKDIIKNKLKQLPEHSFREIIFETEILSLFKVFDRFIHVPVDKYCEAYGQVYVEALLAKIPSILTLSGIANSFVQHKENAWVVDYKNSEAIYNTLQEMDSHPELVKQCSETGEKTVRELFSMEKMISSLHQLYLD